MADAIVKQEGRLNRCGSGLLAFVAAVTLCAAAPVLAVGPGDNLPGLDGKQSSTESSAPPRRSSRLRFGGDGPACMCSGDGLTEESIRAGARGPRETRTNGEKSGSEESR